MIHLILLDISRRNKYIEESLSVKNHFFNVELTGKTGEKYSFSPYPEVILKSWNNSILARLQWLPQRIVEYDIMLGEGCEWEGQIPSLGAVATCNLDMPWEVIVKEAVILPKK